jgi:redox-sensitive bicupin YhaK (pirin superfamily)
MIHIRRAAERGHADHGWLDSHHTFSFADYHDPAHMGFRSLRVINDDRVAGGKGFGPHPHRDMEILSYVLEGGLAHKDSTGTGAVIRPGDVQRMSAGTGVVHSEHNASRDEVVHFLQIWLLPSQRGLPPGYEQKTFSAADKQGKLVLVASPDGQAGSVTIHSDARVYAGVFGPGEHAELSLPVHRGAWVHVARGRIRINDQELSDGDGIAIEGETTVRVEGIDGGEVLAFDLA